MENRAADIPPPEMRRARTDATWAATDAAIQIWYIKLASPERDDEARILRHAWPLLDGYEREVAFKLRSYELQYQYVAAHACTKIDTSRALSTSVDTIHISRRCALCGHPRHGKPALTAPCALRFNIAHTEGWLMLGTHRGADIGVDVEIRESTGKWDELATAVLTIDEQKLLRVTSPENRSIRILQFWTMKEAYLKRLGLGFRQEPKEVNTLSETVRQTTRAVEAPSGLVASLSAERPDAAIRIMWILAADLFGNVPDIRDTRRPR